MRSIHSRHTKLLSAIFIASLFVLISGCGGRAVGVADTTSVTTAATASSIQLLVSSSQTPSAGVTPEVVTATVLTATRQPVAGVAVEFSSNNDPSAYFSSVSATTDANGIATAKLNLGNNKSNRTISISATSGTAVGSNAVDVTGTTISISGNSSLALNASTVLTLSVKDSAGTAIPGIAVSVTSQKGNTIALNPSSGITDSSGQITATVTAIKTDAVDVISASAAGTAKTQNLSISSSSFVFTAPSEDALIPINTATPVSINWANAGTPVGGSVVNFSASRGTISASGTTSSAGVATASINSANTGPAIISATGPGGTPAVSRNVIFYTTSATTVSAQTNPSTIQVTTGTVGQTSNSAVVSVVVRDAANNLVPNAQVNFSIESDPTGGSLSSSTATTDSYGQASVNYLAGAVSSPQNGVVIQATVVSINGTAITPVTESGRTTLTVSGQSLLVRLGTDQYVLDAKPVNQKTYVAIVTDAGGNAVVGTTVTFKLRPIGYWKGQYEQGANKWIWTPSTWCSNEDNGGTGPASLSFNGIVDPGEDINGNTSLEPGGVAAITVDGVTDANGVATATITYAKDHSWWASFFVEARAGVNSNDPPSTAKFDLDGLASDYTDLNVNPPGLVSPYGTSTSCSDDL